MLILVRHPEPLVRGVCAGHADVPVAEPRGAAQQVYESLVRGVLLAGARPARVVSSPTARARELAEHLAALLGVPVAHDARLRELYFGAWEGRTWSEIEQNDKERMTAWMADWQSARPPGGEALGELDDRVRSWLRESELQAKPILAVTHAGVIRAVLVSTGQLAWPEAMSRNIPYLDPFVLHRQ